MTPERFSQAVNAMGEQTTNGFVKLVLAAGLDPTTDFVNADMSGADLRDQDLRRFNFDNATFHGTAVGGALFNSSVSPEQLLDACPAPARHVFIVGPRLETKVTTMAGILGPSYSVDTALAEGVVNARNSRDRKLHLKVSRDRLTNGEYNAAAIVGDLSSALPQGNFVLAETYSRFDIDIVKAVFRRLQSDGKTFSAFLICRAHEELSQARLRELNSLVRLAKGNAMIVTNGRSSTNIELGNIRSASARSAQLTPEAIADYLRWRAVSSPLATIPGVKTVHHRSTLGDDASGLAILLRPQINDVTYAMHDLIYLHRGFLGSGQSICEILVSEFAYRKWQVEELVRFDATQTVKVRTYNDSQERGPEMVFITVAPNGSKFLDGAAADMPLARSR